LTTKKFDLKVRDLIWFSFEFILILFCDLNKSQVSVGISYLNYFKEILPSE